MTARAASCTSPIATATPAIPRAASCWSRRHERGATGHAPALVRAARARQPAADALHRLRGAPLRATPAVAAAARDRAVFLPHRTLRAAQHPRVPGPPRRVEWSRRAESDTAPRVRAVHGLRRLPAGPPRRVARRAAAGAGATARSRRLARATAGEPPRRPRPAAGRHPPRQSRRLPRAGRTGRAGAAERAGAHAPRRAPQPLARRSRRTAHAADPGERAGRRADARPLAAPRARRMAGDRVPLHDGRRATVDFLGRPAPFAQGPWLLAGLLGCPVNLMCCLKIAGRYEIRLERFLDAPAWERGQRDATIAGWVQRYADRLAEWCLLAPQQWFNFYPYWETVDA